MKIILVQTAYWDQVREFQKAPTSDEKASVFESFGITSNYTETFTLEGLETVEHLFNFREKRTDQKNSNRLLEHDFFYHKWQLVSRVPFIGSLLFWMSGPVRALKTTILRENPDAVFFLNMNVCSPRLGRWIGKRGAFVIGQHASALPPRAFARNFNLVFSALPWQVRWFQARGVRSILVPLGLPKQMFVTHPSPIVERSFEVSFVGSFGRGHRDSVRFFGKIAREIPGFRLFTSTPLKRLKKYGLGEVFAGKAHGQETLEVYRNSKIVVNRHINQARGHATNFRMYEATGSGAVLLTEDFSNLCELFQPGQEVVVYKSNEDAVTKLRSLLGDPERMQRIASAGYSRARSAHTIEDRALTISSEIKNLFRDRLGSQDD